MRDVKWSEGCKVISWKLIVYFNYLRCVCVNSWFNTVEPSKVNIVLILVSRFKRGEEGNPQPFSLRPVVKKLITRRTSDPHHYLSSDLHPFCYLGKRDAANPFCGSQAKRVRDVGCLPFLFKQVKIRMIEPEPIGPKLFVGSRVTPGKVYDWSKFKKLLADRSLLAFLNCICTKIKANLRFCNMPPGKCLNLSL